MTPPTDRADFLVRSYPFPPYDLPPYFDVVYLADPKPAANLAIVYFSAVSQVGVPYVWGTSSEDVSFDCSGFVDWTYDQAGVNLPRTTQEIRAWGTVITQEQALPGDILWWPGHVAIYAGPGYRLDANHAGDVVNIRPIYGNPTYLRITEP